MCGADDCPVCWPLQGYSVVPTRRERDEATADDRHQRYSDDRPDEDGDGYLSERDTDKEFGGMNKCA